MQCLAKMKRTQNAFRASAVLGLAAWFILSAGCARVPQPPSLPPSPAALSAEELVARLQARGAAIQTLKAQFAIEATGTDIKGARRRACTRWRSFPPKKVLQWRAVCGSIRARWNWSARSF